MTYTQIIIAISVLPLVISLSPWFRWYWSKRLLLAILGTAAPFLIWDIWATAEGQWAFHPSRVIGWYGAGLPVEEILFFLAVPFACLLLFEGFKILLPHERLEFSPIAKWAIIVITLVLLVSGQGRPYTTLVSTASLVVFVFGVFKKSTISFAALSYFASGFGLFLLFNSILTSVPVVTYAPWAIIGLRFGTIPIEDIWYNFLLLGISLLLYTWNNTMKRQSNDSQEVFKEGSTTYFTASRFFSPAVRQKVTTLYAFVRIADNYVDQLPAKKREFNQFLREYQRAYHANQSARPVIAQFVALVRQTNIDPKWIEAFFQSMIQDTKKRSYATLSELEKYIYGSANVVGLMMARIFGLSKTHDSAAEQLGKAMQYCNMLRDVAEDLELGRVYIPVSILKKYGLQPLTKAKALKKSKQFKAMMQGELERCLCWFDRAERGIPAIPRRERVAVRTATAMYRWTAEQLHQSPQTVWFKKLKPSKLRVIVTAIRYLLTDWS